MDEKNQQDQQHNYGPPTTLGIPPAYQESVPSNYNQYGGTPSIQYAGPTAVVVTGQPNTATTIVTGQPTSIVDQYFSNVPRPWTTRICNLPRPWTTGICNCCVDCKICFLGLFCPGCYSGTLAMKLDENCMAGWCCFAHVRTKFRMKHNIQGSVCEDGFQTAFCGPCVVCQMGREMKTLNYGTRCGCC